MLSPSYQTFRLARCQPSRELHPMLLKLLSAMTIILGTLIRLMERVYRLMVQLFPRLRRQPPK
jgi:hypothetical protein